jgi:hypothetical protein
MKVSNEAKPPKIIQILTHRILTVLLYMVPHGSHDIYIYPIKMLLMLAYIPAPWILWVSDPPWETHFHGYHGSCRWAGKSGVNPGDLALFFFQQHLFVWGHPN